jgi:hypothetical protein
MGFWKPRKDLFQVLFGSLRVTNFEDEVEQPTRASWKANLFSVMVPTHTALIYSASVVQL